MDFWSKKTEEFEAMDQVIQKHPGISAAELLRKLEVGEKPTSLCDQPDPSCFHQE